MGKHQKILDPDLAYLMDLGYGQEITITALTEAMGNVSQAFQHLFEDLTGKFSIACLTVNGTCTGCREAAPAWVDLTRQAYSWCRHQDCAHCNSDPRCLQFRYLGSLCQRLICLQIPIQSGFLQDLLV